MATRILLIRHALAAADSRLCGSLDVPLSPAGLAQVTRLLQQHPTRSAPHALYTSTLRRASHVATLLGRTWALEPRPAPWAREIHCGDVEGMPLDEVQRRFPELWARNQAENDDDFAWPGGETYREFRARVLAGMRALAAAHPGEQVATVTHAGVISQVLGTMCYRAASVWSIDRPDLLTATEVAWDGDAPAAVLTYNERDWY